MDIPVRDLLRKRGTPYEELGLNDPALSDAQLLDAMMAHPILVNRPIFVRRSACACADPSEAVLNNLQNGQGGAFNKANGEPSIAPAAPPVTAR